MAISLEGVSLHVKDFEQSKEFYSRIPGAKLVYETGGFFASFQIGKSILHIVHFDSPLRFHLEVGADNVDKAYQEFKSAGLSPEEPEERPWGKYDFRVTDPDGNRLEVGRSEGGD